MYIYLLLCNKYYTVLQYYYTRSSIQAVYMYYPEYIYKIIIVDLLLHLFITYLKKRRSSSLSSRRDS